jgi:hypothetical protein
MRIDIKRLEIRIPDPTLRPMAQSLSRSLAQELERNVGDSSGEMQASQERRNDR